MSILPRDPDVLSRLSTAEQLQLVCSSGRPFGLIQVQIVDEAGNKVQAGTGKYHYL